MKKNLLMLLSGVVMAFPAIAEDFVYEYEGQTLVYTVLDEEAKTCQTQEGSSEFDYTTWKYVSVPGNEVSGNLVLPANPKNGEVEYTLVRLGDFAFVGDSELTSIDIPATVTYIGDDAFDGCTGLTKSNFASMEALLNIEFYAGAGANPIYFSHNLYIGGEEVTNPVLPENATKLNNYVFAGLTSMTTLEMPSTVTSIGTGAFNSCTALEKLTVPEGVTSIEQGAFMFCSGLRSIELPSTLENVAGWAFYQCDSLKRAEFGSIESLCGINFGDTYANPLRYATHLYVGGEEVTEVVVPETVTEIKNYAFIEGNYITSVTLPESLEKIGLYGFNHCYRMTSVNIPSSVTTIGQQAFEGCPALTEMLLPPSVTSVGNMAFNNCSGIVKSAYPEQLETNPFLVKDPWGQFPDINYGGTTIAYDAEKAEVVDGVLYTDAMTTVKYVPVNAGPVFNVPEGVVYLANNSFAYCSALKTVVLPEGLMGLGENVFVNTDSLTEVQCNATTMAPMVTDNSFSASVYENATLYVPEGCQEMYAAADGWKNFKNIVEGTAPGAEVVLEGDFVYEYEGQSIIYTVLDSEAKTCQTKAGSSEYSFETWSYVNVPGNEVVGELVLPANPKFNGVELTLVALGDYSFIGDTELTSVEIPATVELIGDCAFEYCTGLTKSGFASMEALMNTCFYNGAAANPIYYSHNLYIDGEEVTTPVIPATVTQLNSYVFAGLNTMTTLEIPASVTKICEGAFNSCAALENITLPEGVDTIGTGAFMFCSSLRSVALPTTLKSVAGYTFYQCDSLKRAEFGSIESLCGIDFGDTYANPLRYATHLYVGGEEVTEVVVPETVTEIKNYAFIEGNYITSVTLPESLEKIGIYGFNHCYRMTSINIPGSVTTIGQKAFEGCPALTEMLLPPSVTSVGTMAFNNCSGIVKSAYPEQLETNPFLVKDQWGMFDDLNYGGTTITYNAETAELVDGVLYTDGMTTVKYVPINAGPDFDVPAGVIYLADNSFAYCQALESVVLPEELMALGENVFAKADSLTAVQCNAATMAPMAVDNSFPASVYENATLYVPEGCQEMYATADGWKNFKHIVEGTITGVMDVTADVDYNAPYEVYNLNGVRVANNVEGLASGIYVVRQGTKARKVAVK